MIAYIRNHPQTTFIIGHLFGLEDYIKADLCVENVYFEISAPPFLSIQRVNKAISSFGARKIILGSDTPYGKENLRVNIERVKNLAISDEGKQLILGGNLQRLLKLS